MPRLNWTVAFSNFDAKRAMESLFLVVVVLFQVVGNSAESVHSRHKRVVAFPEGASLSMALCLTTNTIMPMNVFSQGVNWGLSYDLPNDTSTFQQFLHPKRVMQRRHRRDLYQKMEIIMNRMGFEGRTCIFRALCEASRKLVTNENSILEEFLRIIFRFPLQQLTRFEPEEHRLYHRAYRIGRDSDEDCSDIFVDCPFSLVDMALGTYST